MDWCSVYSARALTLPDYVHGRVLFTGDAAHMLPIFGVRGANTGWQDAQCMAWRLAFVARGVAPESLLQSYSSERVAAAWEIIDEAGKSTRFMTPPTRGFRLLRDAVLSLSLSQPFVGPLYHWRTSRPHEYTQSPLNSAGDDNGLFKAGPGHGAPPQNIRLGADDYLLDHLGGGFRRCCTSLRPGVIPEPLRTGRGRYTGQGRAAAGGGRGRCRARGRRRSDARRCGWPLPPTLRRAGRRCRLPAAPRPARLRPLDEPGRGASAVGPCDRAGRPDWQFINPCRPERGLIMSHSKPLSVPDLEQVYDALATAIDEAGPEKSELFLVKLALLNANALGDAAAFEAQVAAALKDL
jgi:hypothetical protein